MKNSNFDVPHRADECRVSARNLEVTRSELGPLQLNELFVVTGDSVR
jgi:hypothetical protein